MCPIWPQLWTGLKTPFMHSFIHSLRANHCSSNSMFSQPWWIGIQKTLYEKMKILVTSIFSFSHSFSLLTGSLCLVYHTPICCLPLLSIWKSESYCLVKVFVICFQSVSLGKGIGSPLHNTHMGINSSPNDKILDLPKLAAFADEARACDDCPLEPNQLSTY